jgi:hypothetical protein
MGGCNYSAPHASGPPYIMSGGYSIMQGFYFQVDAHVMDQDKGEIPEHQERRARYYRNSTSWQAREVYDVEAVSWKSVMGLPATLQMSTS